MYRPVQWQLRTYELLKQEVEVPSTAELLQYVVETRFCKRAIEFSQELYEQAAETRKRAEADLADHKLAEAHVELINAAAIYALEKEFRMKEGEGGEYAMKIHAEELEGVIKQFRQFGLYQKESPEQRSLYAEADGFKATKKQKK